MHSQDQEKLTEELIPELLEYLESDNSKALTDKIESLHPSTLSDVLTNVDVEIRDQILQHITGLDSISDLVAHASELLREALIKILDDSRLAAIIRRLDLDDAADVLSLIPRRRQVKILKRLNSSLVKELTTLLAYDAQTAGGIMNPRFFKLSPDENVNEAVLRLKNSLLEKEIDDDTDIGNSFVIKNDVLLGVVSLRELLASQDNLSISAIMNTEPITVSVDADQEEAAWKIADYDLTSLPVVSEDNIMVGIITVDDILDVIAEEHEEDLSKLIGTNEDDRVGASVLVSLKSRLPWLFASFAGGTLGAALLGSYSNALEEIVALAFFMPVVFGMGGNVGSQSSTITVRGLATGELNQSRISNRLMKELGIGLSLGILFSILLGTTSYLMFQDFRLSLVVSISIITTMMCASTTGSILPVIFERLGFDPAIAAGPLVATSSDIISIVIYFSIATFLLH